MAAVATIAAPHDALVALMARAQWEPNTLYHRATQTYTDDPAKIVSEVCKLSQDDVDALDLGALVGDALAGCPLLSAFVPPVHGENMKFKRTRLLKYPVGGFVKQHTDLDLDATFRLVFLPPKTAGAWEGGELHAGGGVYTQHPTRWVCVLLNFGVPHKVTEVTAGTRCVIVTDVDLDIPAPPPSPPAARRSECPEADVGPDYDDDDDSDEQDVGPGYGLWD